ncbi:RluA family pseudouridine synthase [Candidatus Peregrinibacteria bacterium]|nr:RluA family pseudouridine synthase [Candidatus Peregrinibacteria bacterium]
MRKILKYKESAKIRLDRFLSGTFSAYSRNFIQHLIKNSKIFVNGENVNANYLLKKGDKIEFIVPSQEVDLIPEHLDFDILFESDSYLIIDKPAGKVVHPTGDAAHTGGTIVNAILDRIDSPETFPYPTRPGIVHRLDKDTSGLMIITKNKTAYEYFVNLFKNRNISKYYTALCVGELDYKEGIIDSPIIRDPKNRKRMAVGISSKAKNSITEYRLNHLYKHNESIFSLLNITLHTGRTHQIRVHFSAIGHPVVGDKVYGNRKINFLFSKNYSLQRQFLHANCIKFRDPDTRKMVEFNSNLPTDLKLVLDLML